MNGFKYSSGLTPLQKIAEREIVEVLIVEELGPCVQIAGLQGRPILIHEGRQQHMARFVIGIEDDPSGKVFALHRCDNKSCIRKEHLYAGDRAQNARDMHERKTWTYPKKVG